MKKVNKKAFINGKVFTGNDLMPWTDTLITEGSKIIFTGAESEARNFIDRQTEIINISSKIILPGFIDSHLHLMTGGFYLTQVDLRSANSKSEFQNIIKEYISKHSVQWILGGNWDHQNFEEKILPHKNWLDEFTQDKPLFLKRTDLHMGLANSTALKLAGIDKSTPNPEGGIIERGDDGYPTGILKDSAMELINRVIPEPTDEEYRTALSLAMKEANRYGVTSVHDMALTGDSKNLGFYKDFFENDKLTCRINFVHPIAEIDSLVELRKSFEPNEFLRIGTVKAFADGSLGSSTAWFHEPYTDEPGFCGLPMESVSNGELRKQILAADKKQIQLAVHAIGDRAISTILDYYEEAQKINPSWDRRFRVEHVQHIAPSDITRMREMNVVASVQPYHLFYDGSWCKSKIGEQRLAGTYAFKSFWNRGIKVSAGSDWTVVSINPLLGIHAAVNRNTSDGNNPNGWICSEKISLHEAVKSYTLNGAFTSFEEKLKGSIEVGKVADFVILDQNIFEIDPKNIKEASVSATIMNGEIIYMK